MLFHRFSAQTAIAAFFTALALPAMAATTVVVSDPVVSNEMTSSVHGSLPGGERTRWSTQEGETSYSDWTQSGDPVVDGNTTVVTETRDASRTDEALNPAGRTVGTDRFDPTTTWTETRTVTTTVDGASGGGNPCGGNCGQGGGGGGGNGTDNEGKGKGKGKTTP